MTSHLSVGSLEQTRMTGETEAGDHLLQARSYPAAPQARTLRREEIAMAKMEDHRYMATVMRTKPPDYHLRLTRA